MSRAVLAAVAAALVAAASPAAAQLSPQVGMDLGPSPRWGSVDLGVLRYKPNLDAGLADPAWQESFGKGYGYMFQAAIWKAIFSGRVSGALELGFRSGYFQKSGDALVKDSNGDWVPSGAHTAFNVIPTSAGVQYRADQLVERFGIPFALYGRAMFERYNWWITGPTSGTSEKGATNGWSASAGLMFLLDIVDPSLAREFDRDSGVNHTYLYFEATKAKIDDFGSSKSWDMSPTDSFAYAAGLTMVF